MKIVILQSVVSLIVPVLLELLKRWRAVPWVTRSTDALNRALAVAAGLAAVVGINAATSWDPASGTWSLTVRGLQVDAVVLLGLQAVGQLLAQEGWYRGFIKSTTTSGPAKLLALILAMSLGAGAVGCAWKSAPATNVRHPAVVASVGVAEALFALDDGERLLYQAGRISEADHKRVSAALVDVLQLGRDANAAILAWRPGQTAPKALQSMLPALSRLTQDAIAVLPGDPKASLLTYVTQVYGAVALVLSLMAGGV